MWLCEHVPCSTAHISIGLQLYGHTIISITTSGQLKIHNPRGGVKTITKTAN